MLITANLGRLASIDSVVDPSPNKLPGLTKNIMENEEVVFL
jgi:hypothetical protein